MADTYLMEYLESFLTERRRARFMEVLAHRTRHFSVAVEDVYQLHNTSAVIRSCDIFGIQDVHTIEQNNAYKLDREIAMGAQKWVDVHQYDDASICMDTLKSKGYQIVATTPHFNDCLLDDFDVKSKSCFVFGRETEGLSRTILDQADIRLKIPMFGLTESLNISVSAAIILQSVTSRLRNADVQWQLTDEEITELRIDWCKKTIKSIDSVMARYPDRS